MSLRLKQGKFYDDAGNVVPPEHGNIEQIRLIEKEEKRISDLKGDGLDVQANFETKYEFSASFKCICGSTISVSGEGDDEFDFSCLCAVTNCRSCKRRYDIELAEYTKSVGDLIVSLAKE